ncbi:hypothetical protein THF1C08_30377 [Vibrio jasicida]|uniref:Uncharacterized protein n=1 Tax=Vibrio jasicida TaxID=766224 RepID=A0AAU9QT58_9VIBR|nr:hypothetical protein THF1C08_30377 [Vibrio jasicida]CAH1599208.1 hypothetical protein THF1A12_40057 [Vibrio jasicida]
MSDKKQDNVPAVQRILAEFVSEVHDCKKSIASVIESNTSNEPTPAELALRKKLLECETLLEHVMELPYKLRGVTSTSFIYLNDTTIANAHDISLIHQISEHPNMNNYSVVLKNGVSVDFDSSDKGVDEYIYEIEETLRDELISNQLKDFS